jgi:hypothetical protein
MPSPADRQGTALLTGPSCFVAPPETKPTGVPTKSFSPRCEDFLKPNSPINDPDQTTRFGRHGIHHQFVLPPVLQVKLDWNAPPVWLPLKRHGESEADCRAVYFRGLTGRNRDLGDNGIAASKFGARQASLCGSAVRERHHG